MMAPFSHPVFCAVALATSLVAQHVRDLDTSHLGSVAFDAARGRFVALARVGKTLELHNGRWRPTPIPWMDANNRRLVFEAATGSVLAIDTTENAWLPTLQVLRLGVDRWQHVPTTTGPSRRGDYALAYDSARSEVVLFGGEVGTFACANDTWVFDGIDWQRRFPAAAPAPRCGAAMAFDRARGRMVLFGGHVWVSLPYNTPFQDTWEWDGANWAQVSVAVPPPVGQQTCMTYDEARQRVTMFHASAFQASQFSSQVYEYDGATWLAAGVPGGPSPRGQASFVYDPVRNTSVLMGGTLNTGYFAADAWEWNGAGWAPYPARTTAYPLPAELLFDPVLQRPIQVDLDLASVPSMRAWDGVSWQPVATPMPPGREQSATCLGPGASYVHGGYTSQAVLTDTWAYDGIAWRQLSGAGPATYAAGMAYDYGANELVLFGGVSGTTVHAMTWTFDGTSWSQRQPATSPPPRTVPLMVYDFPRGRLVLHGGHDANWVRLSDTWQWDGVRWAPVASTVNPTGWLLAFDAQRSRTVLLSFGAAAGQMTLWTLEAFGWQSVPSPAQGLPAVAVAGATAIGFPYALGVLFKTEEFDVYSLSITEAATNDYGVACTASAPRILASAWPRVPTPDLRIDVHGGPTNALLAVLGSTRSANLQLQGCTLLVDPGAAVVFTATNPAGFASVPLPIPAVPSLLGLSLFFQAACLQPTAAAGFTTSRGLVLTLGT